MTVALTDGKRVIAVRYSSDRDSPSLYHSRNLHALHEVGGKTENLPADGMLILSEPLDAVSEHWEKVPEATALSSGRKRHGRPTITVQAGRIK